MVVRLDLKQKLYLVAVYGSIPDHRRKALYRMSSLPPVKLGASVLGDGKRFASYVERLAGPPAIRKRRRAKKLRAL